jgi:small-conductance mechanosensitive channel
MQISRSPARPHLIRAALAAIVAIAGIVMADLGALRGERGGLEVSTTDVVLALSGAALLLIGGVMAVRSLGSAVRETFDARMGPGRSAGVKLLVTILGYVIVILATLRAIGVDLSALLLGGALTGVVIGIAAQQSLGNFFAGIVLMVVKPFTVGEEVVLKSAPLGGEYEGVVTDVGPFYVTMTTARGHVALPNAGVLAAAVGPGVKSPPEDKENGSTAEERGDAAS